MRSEKMKYQVKLKQVAGGKCMKMNEQWKELLQEPKQNLLRQFSWRKAEGDIYMKIKIAHE